MMGSFIIENAINTCYIDSLLVSLFYKTSIIDSVLNKDLKNATGLYLQEYIKERFVNLIRTNTSILQDDIEMIRTICSQLGWLNVDEYMNQQDVTEFYCFLMDTFEIEKLTIQRRTLTDTTISNLVGDKEVIPYIPLHLPESEQPSTIKGMITQWQYDNISTITNQQNNCLNSYTILNSPFLIGFAINRFNNKGIRIRTSVIIQKKIHLNEKKTEEWNFHAAICHKGDTLKSGHYYTLIAISDTSWYIFDDLCVPCMREVRMDDPKVTNMIKKECVFVLYRK